MIIENYKSKSIQEITDDIRWDRETALICQQVFFIQRSFGILAQGERDFYALCDKVEEMAEMCLEGILKHGKNQVTVGFDFVELTIKVIDESLETEIKYVF